MDSLEQFVKSTQIAHGTILQFALEMYRRRKPRMSGVSLCHFITNWPDIEWGLVNYYGLKKLSFDFVKTSYQPLLPSLALPKRRCKPEEMFQEELWIVNDFHEAFENTVLEWTLQSHKGEFVQSGKVATQVDPNSSSKLSDIAWKVDDNVVGEFTVSLILKQGDSFLARNEYKLLIGDLAEAKRICNEHLYESEKKRNEFGSSYYRYNPDLWELE